MTSDLTLGNYQIDEDGSGNLVIKDSTENVVLQHTDGGQWDVKTGLTGDSATFSGNVTADSADVTGSVSGGGFSLVNYQFDEDANGNLIITDSTGNTVLKHTDGGAWDIQRNINHNQNDVSDVNLLETEQVSGAGSPVSFLDNIQLDLLETKQYTQTIADDDFVTLPDNGVTGVVIMNEQGTNSVAVVGASYAGLGDITSKDVTVLTGNNNELSGTTGSDGDLSVGRYFSETRIENRTGSSVTVETSAITLITQ